MADKTPRSKLIRMAHEHPEFRPVLLPILKKAKLVPSNAGRMTDAKVRRIMMDGYAKVKCPVCRKVTKVEPDASFPCPYCKKGLLVSPLLQWGMIQETPVARYASVYFSPDRGAADVVVGFIDRCDETLDAAIYSLTHDAIAEALVRAHQRGVKVRVLIDKTQASSRYADDEKLEEAGIELRRDTQSGIMHNKFLIGDSNAVKTGSFNWTKNADERNAENFVILRLSYVVTAFHEEFERLWSNNAPTG